MSFRKKETLYAAHPSEVNAADLLNAKREHESDLQRELFLKESRAKLGLSR